MIADCKRNKIDFIVTKSVSRFARNVLDCIGYVRELKAMNPPIGVLFETEGIFTLEGRSDMQLHFMATTAQEESHNKSEIMNASIEMRFRRGIFLTPKLLGYDLDNEGSLLTKKKQKPCGLFSLCICTAIPVRTLPTNLLCLGVKPRKVTRNGRREQCFSSCRMKGTVVMSLPERPGLRTTLTINQKRTVKTEINTENMITMKLSFRETISSLFSI